MFELIGYLISLVIISFVVTILVEFTKRFGFIEKLVEFFEDKVKIITFYQFEAYIVSVIVLVILNLLGAITLGTLAVLLNSLVIALLSNGLFTYDVVKFVLTKLGITPKFIDKI